jgi:hypothetical protein
LGLFLKALVSNLAIRIVAVLLCVMLCESTIGIIIDIAVGALCVCPDNSFTLPLLLLVYTITAIAAL